jgi:hypothetical protein
MSDHLGLREAAELHRAESQWLDQCAARLRQAHDVPAGRHDRRERTASPEAAR